MNLLTRSVSPEEVNVYRRDGVVLLKGILSLASVNQLRMAIDQAVGTAAGSPAAYNLTRVIDALEARDLDSLNDLRDGQYDIRALAELIARDQRPTTRLAAAGIARGAYLIDSGVASRLQGFGSFARHQSLGSIAAALMRSDEIRFFDDQIFVKEPQCADKTAFHQDSTYFHARGDQTCVFWISPDPVREENGPMRYVRGSHKWMREFQPNVFISPLAFPGAEGEALPDIETCAEQYDIIQFDYEPGDILVHHYQTVHGAGANLSRYQVRRAASLRYCGDDMVYWHRPYAPPQAHHVHDLINGDPLRADCFPLIWRRQEDRIAA